MDIRIIKDNIAEIESRTHTLPELIRRYDSIEHAARTLREMYEQIQADEAQGPALESRSNLIEVMNQLREEDHG
jgi:uncharacterized protein involved in exopolysaccharide biosynthesis